MKTTIPLTGKDKWLTISGWDVHARHIPDIPAVYAIYLDGVLSYIGQSNTPRFRFTQHKIRSFVEYETPWGKFKSLHIKIKYPSKYGSEAMIEKRLIRKLRPRFNKYTYKKRINGRMEK